MPKLTAKDVLKTTVNYVPQTKIFAKLVSMDSENGLPHQLVLVKPLLNPNVKLVKQDVEIVIKISKYVFLVSPQSLYKEAQN